MFGLIFGIVILGALGYALLSVLDLIIEVISHLVEYYR